MAEGQFDKDFGYLMPFLDKVAAAASGITDRAAREELMRLVADEKPRWARIRQLLSGAAGQPQSKPEAPAAQARPASQALTNGNPSETFREPLSFTVGSLRPRAR
ncbi:MAG TPA: hypothetical protein VF747_15750 [Blastocatellia bacterium]|jgi:hypothetical protein